MLRFSSSIVYLSCFIFSFRSSEAFVYTCNEIKYNLVPNNLSITTPFACVVHQSNVKINFDDEPFNGENVRDLFLVDDDSGERYNFIDIANSTERCLSGVGPWRIESDAPIDQLDCSAEVTLLFSSVLPNIFIPKILGEFLDSDYFIDDEVTVVSPNGGIDFAMFYLAENETGSLDYYTGVGIGPEEELIYLRTQEYLSDAVNIFHFGPVATVKVRTPFQFSFSCSGITGMYEFSYSPVGFEVISSGAASTLQSTLNPRIQINYGLGAIVTLTGTVVFDPEVRTSINVSCTDYDDVVWGEIAISDSGDVNWTSQCRFLDFNYFGTLPKKETIRRSSEVIELILTSVALPSTSTMTSPTTTTTTRQETSTMELTTTIMSDETTKGISTMTPTTTRTVAPIRTTSQTTRRTTTKKTTTTATSTTRATTAGTTTAVPLTTSSKNRVMTSIPFTISLFLLLQLFE